MTVQNVNVARVTVGGPRVAELATRGATCVGYPIVSCVPLFQGARVSFQVSDTTPIQDPRESVKSLFYICHAFRSRPLCLPCVSPLFHLAPDFFRSTKSPPSSDVPSLLFYYLITVSLVFDKMSRLASKNCTRVLALVTQLEQASSRKRSNRR